MDVLKAAYYGRRAKSADDDNGHGTHCAGIVAAIDNEIGVVGVAAGATVIPIKVLDRRGSGYASDIIAGIDYVAANAESGDVANLSLGGGVYTPLDDAVVALGGEGILVAMAAPHVCGLLLLTGGNLNIDEYVNGDPDDDSDPIAHN